MNLLLWCGMATLVPVLCLAHPHFQFKVHHKHSKSRDLSMTYLPNEEESNMKASVQSPVAVDDGILTNIEQTQSLEKEHIDHGNGEEEEGIWKSWAGGHGDYGKVDTLVMAERFKDDLQKPTVKSDTTPTEPCRSISCPSGRVCQALPKGGTSCVCAPQNACSSGRPVCGHDGVLYQSHCELHRQACVLKRRIHVHRASRACQQKSSPEKENRKFDIVDVFEDNKLYPSWEEIIPLKSTSNRDKEVEKTNVFSSQHLSDIAKDNTQSASTISTTIGTPPPLLAKDSTPQASSKAESEECLAEEYSKFKEKLLEYHCSRVGEENCLTSHQSKQFVVNIMFNYYDRSGELLVDAEELADVERRDFLSQLSPQCSLADILRFDDIDLDTRLSLNEFYQAFDVSMVHLPDRLRHFSSTVTSGSSVELKCDVQGASQLVWARNGGLLDALPDEQMRVFKDGSLYIEQIGLHHIGNYTCRDKYNDNVVQEHNLKVQQEPVVTVWPASVRRHPGTTINIKCLANGVPTPTVRWTRNDQPLIAQPGRYTFHYSNTSLEITGASIEEDSATFTCTATNSVGSTKAEAKVVIESRPDPHHQVIDSGEKFVVLHDAGYTVYNPHDCFMLHHVSAVFSNFVHINTDSKVPTLCAAGPSGTHACVWSSAVAVRNTIAYVAQPTLDRVVVIALDGSLNPVEVIPVCVRPVNVKYIESEDQIWVLCWNGSTDAGISSLVVIRDASNRQSTHTVTSVNNDGQKIVVSELLIAGRNDLGAALPWAYVRRPQIAALYKLDLRSLQYVRRVDLEPYGCMPIAATFLHIGGRVLVYCAASEDHPSPRPAGARLALDIITDQVTDYVELPGRPYVTPDGRRVVTIERSANAFSVYSISDLGDLVHVFDEYTSFPIDDVTFFPSERERGYDMYATSAEREDILYINLAAGKIQIIQGVGEAPSAPRGPWSHFRRVISTGGRLGQYLASPSAENMVVLDGEAHQIQCQWPLTHAVDALLWVDPTPAA